MDAIILSLFGKQGDVNALQMSMRAFSIFIISLILVRISGRRSFGIRTPLDNVIVILLGAILSRAVTGSSPFLPVVCASFLLVILHRIMGWVMARYNKVGRALQGKKITLFEKGNYLCENMLRGMVCKEDILQGVREKALTDNMDQIKTVYMERDGEISVVKKDEQ